MKWGLLLIMVLVCSYVAAQPAELKILEEELTTFFPDEQIDVVVAEHASLPELVALDLLEENYPQVASFERIDEEEFTGSNQAVIIGGPMQSALAASILQDDAFDIEKHEFIQLHMIFAQNEDQKYVIVSDAKGMYHLAKPNLEKSPLAKVVPIAAIPVTAAATTISLLWLWQLLVKLAPGIGRKILAGKVMGRVKKRELRHEFKGFQFGGIRFKYREWVAILGSAIIFALAASYVYLTDANKWSVLLITITVNSVVYAIRHGLRLVMDKHHELHTEYHLWIIGAFLTVFSGWLGNTFSLAGYTVKDKESEHGPKINYKINVGTFVVAIILLIVNIFAPSIFLQMCMVLTTSICFIQMIPVNPFAGRSIWGWNKLAWLLAFIPMFVVYAWVNLII